MRNRGAARPGGVRTLASTRQSTLAWRPASVVHLRTMLRQTAPVKLDTPKRDPVDALVERVEYMRLDATRNLKPVTRSALGQFFTPPPVARLMASMFERRPQTIRL